MNDYHVVNSMTEEDFSGDKHCRVVNSLLGDLNIPRISLSCSQNNQPEL